MPIGDIFYFDYGCVAFWGLTQKQEQVLDWMYACCLVPDCAGMSHASHCVPGCMLPQRVPGQVMHSLQ